MTGRRKLALELTLLAAGLWLGIWGGVVQPAFSSSAFNQDSTIQLVAGVVAFLAFLVLECDDEIVRLVDRITDR